LDGLVTVPPICTDEQSAPVQVDTDESKISLAVAGMVMPEKAATASAVHSCMRLIIKPSLIYRPIACAIAAMFKFDRSAAFGCFCCNSRSDLVVRPEGIEELFGL
jgi:hypothetical protein